MKDLLSNMCCAKITDFNISGKSSLALITITEGSMDKSLARINLCKQHPIPFYFKVLFTQSQSCTSSYRQF